MWYYSTAVTMVKLVLSNCSVKCHRRDSIVRRGLSSSSETGARFASERETSGDKCPFWSPVGCLTWDSYMMELVSATKWSNHKNKAQDSSQDHRSSNGDRQEHRDAARDGRIPSAQLGSWKWSSCCTPLSLISAFVK